MKICFITTSIFSLGGVQRVVSVLANELSSVHDVHILCVDDRFAIDRTIYNLKEEIDIEINSELLKKTYTNRIVCKICSEINKNTGFFNNEKMNKILTYMYYPLEIQKKFIKYLKPKNYDIIIGVQGYFSLLLGIISKDIKGKIIGWQHNSYDAYLRNKDKYYWQQDELFKKYIPELYKCIVLTKEDKKLYKANLNVDCEFIYNPISFECQEKHNYTSKNIIAVGRLSEAKGFDMLIKAFSIVNKEKRDWTLKIVGDGPEKMNLIKIIEKYNLKDNVFLVGPSNNVKDHYLESSIFISSSRWEGFGLVVIEAMECGLPVIAFENSGPKEIIDKDGVNGILVNKNDINKLAENIILLIDNEEKRRNISIQSKKRAQDFNIKKIIFEWEKILKELHN